MRDIALLLIIVSCSLAALARPVIGMFCFAWLAFFVPQNFALGFARDLPLSQYVAAGTIGGFLYHRREINKIPFQKESGLLLALWMIFGITTIFAMYPDAAEVKLKYVSKIIIMVFLCTAIIDTENRLLFLFRIIALSLGYYGLKGGIFSINVGGEYTVNGPEMSWLNANNSIGLALSMNLPILYYLSKIDTNKWLKWLYLAMALFSYPAIICTFSRGAWLGAAIVTVFILLRHRVKILLIPVAVIISGIAILMYTAPDKVSNRYDQLINYEKEESAESRFYNWELCKRVGSANPIFGAGFEYYSRKVYEMYYPEHLKKFGGKIWNCHSIWYSMFSEHGYPGLIAWIALMVSCILSLRQIRKYGKNNPEKSYYEHYANMLEAGLLAYMIVGSFIDAGYYDIFYYLVGIIIIIKSLMDANSYFESPVVVPGGGEVHPDESRLATVS